MEKKTRKRSSKSSGKRKSKKKVEFEKGKVYIPAYKMIIFCSCVIAVCVTLLLISTIKSKDSYRPSDENVKIERKLKDNKIEKNEIGGKKESAESKKNDESEKSKKSAKKKLDESSEKKSLNSAQSKKSEKIQKADEKKERPKNDGKLSDRSEKNDEKIESVKNQQKSDENKSKNEDSVKIRPTQNSQKQESQGGQKQKDAEVKKEDKSEQNAAVQKKSDLKKDETKAAEKVPPKKDDAKSPTPKPVPQIEQPGKKIQPNPSETEQKIPVSENKKSYGFPQAKNGAQLVFLFDDGGQNLNHLKPFLELPFPVSIAVLPRLSHSVESAKRIRASGMELMLHQPMQALNEKVNPGPGAIKPDMSENEIVATLFQNINEIGPIAGINNHEGSAITADAEKMEIILKVAAENGIFFLDSRTNKDTKIPYVAAELGYSYFERNGNFLDNEKTAENALKELRKNLDIANKTGSVIMIGHIWSADFLPDFLRDVYPELKEKGYTFSTVGKSKGRKN